MTSRTPPRDFPVTGGPAAEINTGPTPRTGTVEFHLRGPAGIILPRIERAIGTGAGA